MSNVVLHALRNKASLASVPMSAPSRLAAQNIINDIRTEGRGIDHKTFESAIVKGFDNSFIDKLWNDERNKDVVDAFMNNKLCISAAKGDAEALEAFKAYSIQDYFYLLDYVRFKAGRLNTIPRTDLASLQDEVDHIKTDYEFVAIWKDTCLNKMGIDPDRFDAAEPNIAELAYGNVLQNDTRSEDWFSLHVILIGCVYGWSKLSVQLYNDPTTVKDTIFYDNFIKENVAIDENGQAQLADSAVALATFLTENSNNWSSVIEENEDYPKLFRTCMRLETALFLSAYEDLPNTTAGGN